MIDIKIGNSYSQISNMTNSQFSEIRKVLSYKSDPKAAYFSSYGPQVKYLIDKKGSFPTGLLTKVLKTVSSWPVKSITNLTTPPKPRKLFKLELGTITPYADQLRAVEAAYNACRGTISMPTGTGKSLVIALLLNKFQLKTLIVVPTLELKYQLEATIKQVFGSLGYTTVLNIDSPLLLKATDYDLLIVDECHHSAAKTYHKLNKTAWVGIYHRICLTATAYRNNPEETLLFEAIAGDLVFHLSYKDAIAKGYIVPVEAFYYDLPKVKNDYYTWQEVYSNLVVNNQYRNSVIGDALTTMAENDKAVLCLVKEVKHGQNLVRITPMAVPFVNGQDEESRDFIRQFNSGGQMALIGTTGLLGEGVDTKPAEYVIIAGLGKAKSAFMQQIGRGVRTYPGKESCKIILFRDPSHRFTLRHFNEQKKILLEEFGIVPVRLV